MIEYGNLRVMTCRKSASIRGNASGMRSAIVASDDVMLGDDDAVNVDRHQIGLLEVPAHQLRQRLGAVLDEVT